MPNHDILHTRENVEIYYIMKHLINTNFRAFLVKRLRMHYVSICLKKKYGNVVIKQLNFMLISYVVQCNVLHK